MKAKAASEDVVLKIKKSLKYMEYSGSAYVSVLLFDSGSTFNKGIHLSVCPLILSIIIS
jgi:hypothetical protein